MACKLFNNIIWYLASYVKFEEVCIQFFLIKLSCIGGFGVASPDKLMFLHLCEYMLLGLYIDILHAGILHVGTNACLVIA